MLIFLTCFAAGGAMLLSFLLFFHPLRQNDRANKLMGTAVFCLGSAFVAIYLGNAGTAAALISTLRLLAAPLLYLSVQLFVNPVRTFRKVDLLHFLAFVASLFNQAVPFYNKNFEVYYLPLQAMSYGVLSYRDLIGHQHNLKLISSYINETDLSWLRYFTLILLFDFLLWLNEVFLNINIFVRLDPYIYTASIYFLAYCSLRQKTVFDYPKTELAQINEIFTEAQVYQQPKTRKIAEAELRQLSECLNTLLSKEKIYLQNELSLPQLARMLGITIHDASYLVNEVTGDSFFNFINKHRVQEAKKLLASAKLKELNMLGIAFASGFNSKTTFNTTFKKITGQSPSEYVRDYKAEQK